MWKDGRADRGVEAAGHAAVELRDVFGQRLRQHPDALAPDGPDERDAATELPQALGTATARATVAAMDKPRISVADTRTNQPD